jgi:hypothetical protein
MSRNGSGTYSLPAGNPVVSGTTITTTWANNTLTDIANTLTASVASDGQTPMTGALNMGSNKITAVTDPTNAQDAATKAYTDAAITGLSSTYLQKANNLSDVTSASTSRTNLGLGTIATQAASAVAVTGGAIDGTTVGTTTRSTVKATTLDLGLSTQSVAIGQGNASIMKNRIINGAMVIDQRNAGASVNNIVGTSYTLDRWKIYGDIVSKFSVQQNAGSVTPPSGYINYLGATSLSAYTLGTSEAFNIGQRIEGLNITDLDWGTANAKTVTLSFQVYSSLTGTFGGSLRNSASNRSYPFSYSIPTANTWTSISITIAGDTTGTWLTTNGVGINLQFSLGTASNISGTAGVWAAANYQSATGATSVVGTSGATFYITGVQLEVGSSATGFEYVNYQTSLANCQRYYEKSYPQATVPASVAPSGGQYSKVTSNTVQISEIYNGVNFAVTKRANPTLTFYGYNGNSGQVSRPDTGADLGANSATMYSSNDMSFSVRNNNGSTLTTVSQVILYWWVASSEL